MVVIQLRCSVARNPLPVGFAEQSAFRHYLHALRQQVRVQAQTTSFDEAVDGHRRTLDDAETTLRVNLGSAGIRGQQRDFTVLDVNRAALELFVSLRGPMLPESGATSTPGFSRPIGLPYISCTTTSAESTRH